MPFYGWSYQPFTFGGLNDATTGFLNNAGNASDPLRNALAAYRGQLSGIGAPSTFLDWLSSNRGYLTDLYEQENAQRLAAGGGLDSQVMPIDWLAGKNLWGTFLSQSPRERGENPGAFTPFTRFLTR